MTIGLLTVLAVASHLCEVYLSGWIIYKVSISMSRVWKVFANVKGYFAFLTQKGAMPQVLGLLRAWLYSICRFVQPRPDGCLSRIKRQSNTAYSIVQPWLDDRVSLICLYKLPDSWRRRIASLRISSYWLSGSENIILLKSWINYKGTENQTLSQIYLVMFC